VAQVAVPDVLRLLQGPDAKVAGGAAKALARLGDESTLKRIIEIRAASESLCKQQAVEQAMNTICARPDRARCSDILIDGLAATKGDARKALIRLFGTTRGEKSLGALRKLLEGENVSEYHEAVRVLSDWKDADALGDLAELAESGRDEKARILGLRGYVRLLQESKLDQPTKAKGLVRAMAAAKRKDERRLVLGAAAHSNHPEALQLAAGCLPDKEVAREASYATMRIMSRIGGDDHHDAVRSALEAVVAHSPDKGARDRAAKRLGEMEAKEETKQ
jgi:HEAT repeat protein